VVVGLKTPRTGQIGDVFREYGAIEVHSGDAKDFHLGATRAGQIGPAIADIIQGITMHSGSGSQESTGLAPEAEPIGFSTRGENSDGESGGVGPPGRLGGGSGGREEAVQRFIEGRFPRRVRLGEKCYLEVRISVQVPAGANASQVKQGVLPEGKPANVLLLLQAADFKILSGNRDRTVTVPASGNSDFVMWELQAERASVSDLSVTAYYSGVPLGELALQTTVDVGIETGPSQEQSSAAYFRKTGSGEYTLVLHYEPGTNTYRYDFISAAGAYTPDLHSEPLKRTPEDAIGALISDLNSLARGKSKMDGPATRSWLRGRGSELWTEFIPEKLQNGFWEQRNNIKRIRVLSSGDPIPWELLYPTEPGKAPDENTGFLGEAFSLTRWRFGSPPDPRLNNGPVCFVVPTSAPPQATAEVEKLKGVMGTNSTTVRTLAELSDVLKTGEFGILHFACHNLFDLKGFGSRISMPDGWFDPSTLVNYKGKFSRPFVFMNACRTDGVAASYTRLTGWADKFLDTGAGAFVGSLWEVRDQSAALFAATFYQNLRQNPAPKTLSEAMKAARESIGDVGGDPTWLAYSTYGNADACTGGSS
jgi:hypothetical protein